MGEGLTVGHLQDAAVAVFLDRRDVVALELASMRILLESEKFKLVV